MAEHICRLPNTLGNCQLDHEWDAIGEDLLVYVGLSDLDFDDLAAQMENNGITTTGYYDH